MNHSFFLKFESSALNERNTVIGDVWRKLGSGDESQKFWKILQKMMTRIEPFSIGPSLTGSRRSSKVKIVDIRFLSVLSAQKEMCLNATSGFLLEQLPVALPVYLTLWSVLLDSVLPVSHAGSAKSSLISPSLIMSDLITCYLQKSKLLSAAKKSKQLPDSIRQERITTQDVTAGLRSIIDSISQENPEKSTQIIKQILANLSDEFGQKSWEADLCLVSLLCDSIPILLKSMKASNHNHQSADQSDPLLLEQIIEQLKIICKEQTDKLYSLIQPLPFI